MPSDPELLALLDQAARNLQTLELLVRHAGDDANSITELQERLRDLKRAYTSETDALTQQVLKRAVERRSSAADRRHSLPAQTNQEQAQG